MSEREQKTHIGTVVAVYPNKVLIEIDKFEGKETRKQTEATMNDTDLKIGQFLEISDGNNFKFIVIIDNFRVEAKQDTKSTSDNSEPIQRHIVEATPIGIINGDKFTRGCNDFAYPPKTVKPALAGDLEQIYKWGSDKNTKFDFCKLSNNKSIKVSVNGNKFFNKHFAIVGASGSGKSHTVAKILQNAISAKNGEFSLNNSHIVIFDIHGEYKTAFPKCNYIDCNKLNLPYWMMNSEELEDMFIVTDGNDHNQRSIFQESIVENKKLHSNSNDTERDKIHFDSPEKFSLKEVIKYIKYRNQERRSKSGINIEWIDTDGTPYNFPDEKGRLFKDGQKPGDGSQGLQYGKLDNFINRLENITQDKRIQFLFGEDSQDIKLESVITSLIGYHSNKSNITIIDLGGVPFEVLNITVSLISRILFDFSYFSKSTKEIDTPLLLVYEEAHKYVPNSELAKYNSSRNAIERIAKEGRKYGITLGIVSQRPSEISETIFSQCSSFISMRLTNPDDQSYVKKLLPDTLGNITETLPSLEAGEAILIGESVPMPSIVKIDPCDENLQPSSNDIKYFELWKEEWKNIDFDPILDKWKDK